jgi:hypothetical protein
MVHRPGGEKYMEKDKLLRFQDIKFMSLINETPSAIPAVPLLQIRKDVIDSIATPDDIDFIIQLQVLVNKITINKCKPNT